MLSPHLLPLSQLSIECELLQQLVRVGQSLSSVVRVKPSRSKKKKQEEEAKRVDTKRDEQREYDFTEIKSS